MQADLIGDMTIGLTSGIEPAFQPSSWQNVEVMSATIRPVFFPIKWPPDVSKAQEKTPCAMKIIRETE